MIPESVAVFGSPKLSRLPPEAMLSLENIIDQQRTLLIPYTPGACKLALNVILAHGYPNTRLFYDTNQQPPASLLRKTDKLRWERSEIFGSHPDALTKHLFMLAHYTLAIGLDTPELPELLARKIPTKLIQYNAAAT